ncbi:MAG: transglutaminase domain-containing protein [Pseudomonadales bacterium]
MKPKSLALRWKVLGIALTAASFNVAALSRIARQFGLLSVIALLPACNTLPVSDVSTAQRQALINEVLSGHAVLGRSYSPAELPQDDILHLTPEMEDFVERYVQPVRSRYARSSSLLRAVLSPGMLGVNYSEDDTKTAEEAFRARSANCLGFSNLFIALAREAGLKAYYQDVLVAPEWDLNDGVVNLRRHINVIIHGGGDFDQVIDISRSRRNLVRLESKRLTDRQAFAQYYNNIAIDHMFAEDYETAFLYSRKALMLDKRSAFIWSNLGVIVSRVGKVEHAEAVLLKAASLNGSERAALVNLSALYRARGQLELAQKYEDKVQIHRARNPYYLMISAGQAHASGESVEALRLLKKAIKLKTDEARIFELLARVYQELGQLELAVEAVASAIDVADTERQRNEYDELLRELRLSMR